MPRLPASLLRDKERFPELKERLTTEKESSPELPGRLLQEKETLPELKERLPEEKESSPELPERLLREKETPPELKERLPKKGCPVFHPPGVLEFVEEYDRFKRSFLASCSHVFPSERSPACRKIEMTIHPEK